MQLDEVVAQLGGYRSMARELGVTEAQASSGAAALLPAILGGFQKQVQTRPDGLAGLGGLLGQLGGGDLLDNVLSPQPTDVSKGNDVLGAIFGSKDVSRAVAQKAATTSGVDSSILRKMLPMLAMVVTGVMAKQGGGAAQAPTSGGGLGGLLGGLLGGGSGRGGGGGFGALASMLDSNRDGNPLDDIMRMMGGQKG